MSASALREPAHAHVRALTFEELAWTLALPCALLTAAAVALLGPVLGHAFLEPGSETFWPGLAFPEPVEHGRYLVSLIGPPLLAAAVLLLGRRHLTGRVDPVRRLALAGQLALVAFLVVCFAAQNHVLLSADRPLQEPTEYFTVPTLLVALALPALLLELARMPAARTRIAQLWRETPTRRAVCMAVAVLFTAIWLLTAVNADGSVANTAVGVRGHILWSMNETFAILDGRTPLVSFHAEYGQLWPYLAAGAMWLLGTSIGVYTTTMATISGLALLAIHAVFRRVVRNSLLALGLFLPFVATGFFMKIGPLDNRYGPANLYSLWPVRYAGPYVLAWLLARHVDRATPRRTWPLFLLAGLAILNNPEFGTAALAATLTALLCVGPPRSWRAARALAGSAAAGLLGAVALVTLLTLAHSGSLPRFGLLLEFTRLYAVGGWAMMPMPRIGIFLAVYVTFAAAIVVAVVRAARGADRQPVLTAMLAWSGVFGLIAGGYFAGRSHPQVLIDLFSPWCLALGLLLVVVVRGLAARGWRRPAPAELVVLFGFGLAVCSLAQTPTPWSQIARIGNDSRFPLYEQRGARAFVAQATRPHERIAVLIPLGHRIAYDTGRVNVSPYSSSESMPTTQQLRTTIDALRASHGSKLFLSMRFTSPGAYALLLQSGFAVARRADEPNAGQMVELVDRAGDGGGGGGG